MDSIRTHLPEFEIMLRLLLAAGLSTSIGIDREMREKAAGLRTHMLVAVAAALFTVLTFEIHAKVGAASNADPLRIIDAVTAGVAFLAGGAIIRGRDDAVRGLTTGAGMWLAGSIGVACGAGMYTIAVMGAALAVIVLSFVPWVERRFGSPDESKRE